MDFQTLSKVLLTGVCSENFCQEHISFLFSPLLLLYNLYQIYFPCPKHKVTLNITKKEFSIIPYTITSVSKRIYLIRCHPRLKCRFNGVIENSYFCFHELLSIVVERCNHVTPKFVSQCSLQIDQYFSSNL